MADSGIVSRKSEMIKEREIELLKTVGMKKSQEQWLSTQTKNDLIRLAMAGISSTIAQFFVHGVETVKVRMQVEGNAARVAGLPMKYSNVYTGGVYVYQHEGIAGLYKVRWTPVIRQGDARRERWGGGRGGFRPEWTAWRARGARAVSRCDALLLHRCMLPPLHLISPVNSPRVKCRLAQTIKSK